MKIRIDNLLKRFAIEYRKLFVGRKPMLRDSLILFFLSIFALHWLVKLFKMLNAPSYRPIREGMSKKFQKYDTEQEDPNVVANTQKKQVADLEKRLNKFKTINGKFDKIYKNVQQNNKTIVDLTKSA